LIFSSGTPFSLRRDSEISPSQKPSRTAPVFFQVDLYGHLPAFFIGDKLNAVHGSIFRHVTLYSYR
jgi:hypothetical protein